MYHSLKRRSIPAAIAIGAALILSSALLVNCSDDSSPVRPSPPANSELPSGSSSSTAQDPAPPPPAPTDDVKDRYSWSITGNSGTNDVTVTNTSSENHSVGLACYSGTADAIDDQVLHSSQFHSIGSGSTGEYSVDLPCGPWQCDLFEGSAPAPEPPRFGRSLIFGRVGRGEACTPPPPTGCSLELACREQPVERNQRATREANGIEKHVLCNLPGSWSHNADGHEAGETQFWGFWESTAQERTASVKFTAARDARCMQSFEWPVPVDPCANARLSSSFQSDGPTNNDNTWRVSISVQSDRDYTVEWDDGQSTGPNPPGISTVHHVYQRGEQEQTFTVTVTNGCLTRRFNVKVPPKPSECVPPPEQKLCFQDADTLRATTNTGCTPIDGPLGSPSSECSFFGEYEPGTPGDFFVTKCGGLYEITHDPFNGQQCSNGQDVSHTTACVCEVDED